MKTEIKVVIADDHPIFRAGLKQAIERDPQLKVLDEAGDGAAALECIRRSRPDVAVLDVEMPVKDGFDVVRGFRELRLPVIPIFLTMHKDETHLNEALNLGVKGYVLKDGAATEVATCIKAVVAGQTYISGALSAYLLERRGRSARLSASKPNVDELTDSERRVLKLLAEYKTSKEIAALLGISPRTVENHRANICARLELQGTHALVKFAIQHKSELD
ncbi:MAG: response regulator transcription factor [Acidobacteriaceae bacterium]|nr:response regulator transcription factor [Acidobacteriaceae bacterium]